MKRLLLFLLLFSVAKAQPIPSKPNVVDFGDGKTRLMFQPAPQWNQQAGNRWEGVIYTIPTCTFGQVPFFNGGWGCASFPNAVTVVDNANGTVTTNAGVGNVQDAIRPIGELTTLTTPLGTNFIPIWNGTNHLKFAISTFPDFWRSGTGATTNPDGATDLTEAIRRNGSIGINADPTATVHQDGGAVASYFKATNNTTGKLATDGFDVGVAAGLQAELRQRENSDMLFYTNNIERARIASNGDTGIGVIPTSKLHVNGANATATAIRLSNGTTTGTTAVDGTELGLDVAGNAELRNRENTALRLYTNNLQRLEIAGSGNVGIHTTPSTQGYALREAGLAMYEKGIVMPQLPYNDNAASSKTALGIFTKQTSAFTNDFVQILTQIPITPTMRAAYSMRVRQHAYASGNSAVDYTIRFTVNEPYGSATISEAAVSVSGSVTAGNRLSDVYIKDVGGFVGIIFQSPHLSSYPLLYSILDATVSYQNATVADATHLTGFTISTITSVAGATLLTQLNNFKDVTVQGIPRANQASFTLISDDRAKSIQTLEDDAAICVVKATRPIVFVYNGNLGSTKGQSGASYSAQAIEKAFDECALKYPKSATALTIARDASIIKTSFEAKKGTLEPYTPLPIDPSKPIASQLALQEADRKKNAETIQRYELNVDYIKALESIAYRTILK